MEMKEERALFNSAPGKDKGGGGGARGRGTPLLGGSLGPPHVPGRKEAGTIEPKTDFKGSSIKQTKTRLLGTPATGARKRWGGQSRAE